MVSVKSICNGAAYGLKASSLADLTPSPPDDDSMDLFFGPTELTKIARDQQLLLEGLLSTDRTLPNPGALAMKMLHAYGTLPKVLCAPPEDVARLHGVSSRHANRVRFAYDALVGCLFDQVKERPLLDYEALIALVQYTIGQSAVEKVQLFFLNNRNRVFGTEVLCSGSETFVSVSIKTVIAAACRKNASSFIIAHNHPGGSIRPSRHDLEFTERLFSVSVNMDIGLIDSLIVSGCDYYSFRKAGQL
jgi:DNA repair protein RadC